MNHILVTYIFTAFGTFNFHGHFSSYVLEVYLSLPVRGREGGREREREREREGGGGERESYSRYRTHSLPFLLSTLVGDGEGKLIIRSVSHLPGCVTVHHPQRNVHLLIGIILTCLEGAGHKSCDIIPESHDSIICTTHTE